MVSIDTSGRRSRNSLAQHIAAGIVHHVRVLRPVADRLAQHGRDDAVRRPLHQLERKRAADAVAEEEELADAEMVHQPQLVVGESVPRIVDRDRAGGFAVGGVALIHRDEAEVVLEFLHRVDDRVWPIADPRVQAAARGGQQREAGADLLVTDADVALSRRTRCAACPALLGKHARRRGHRRCRGARCEDIASDRIHHRRLPGRCHGWSRTGLQLPEWTRSRWQLFGS